jgi:hypothetical protein
MLTSNDLRDIADSLFHLTHDIRQGGMSGLKLLQSETLPISVFPSDSNVHPSVQLGHDPFKISKTTPPIERFCTRSRVGAAKNAAG